MRIKPFPALRPPPDLAAGVASPPYDVLNDAEARRLGKDNPLSFLHIVRPEIDLPPETAADSDAAYQKAADNLEKFVRKGFLSAETQPVFFIYRQSTETHSQSGVVALSSVADYDSGVIRKHEHTRPGPEDDRIRHIRTLQAQTGPVFLCYRDERRIENIVAGISAQEPQVDFHDSDGVQHSIWRADDADSLATAFAALPAAYIADGHHRAAAAARVASERRDSPPHQWFLSVIFPAGQLRVLAYNRLLHDIGGARPKDIIAALRQCCRVTEEGQPRPGRPGKFGLYLDGNWYGLEWDPQREADVVKKLDASFLQDRILGPLFNIEDPRRDPRISFVGGEDSIERMTAAVDSGRAAAAFSLYPTTVEQLMAVSDAGRVMPPKSTWFAPKLCSGLFVYALT